MAITKTYINNDMQNMTTFLQQLVPEYFGEVSINSENNLITLKDGDGNTVFTIAKVTGGYNFTAYNKDGSTAVSNCTSDSNSSNPGTIAYGYTCSNGALLALRRTIVVNGYATYPDVGGILITKTNSGETAVVFSYSTTINFKSSSFTNIFTNVYAVAYSDASPLNRFSYTANSNNQTLIVPFPTTPEVNVLSYTPKAGYLPAGQYFSMGCGKLILNGVTYLTNGYWAIRDEAETE